VTELVLALFGPTASGKSAVAEALAERIPAEVVSADSMQVYRGLPLLTDQPSLPTRLVGIWDLAHEASVGEYQELAHAAIDEILSAGRTPVVVGGTGLYLRAALAELRLPPAPAPGARERWEGFYDLEGAERAHSVLSERDPEAAAAVHPNDRRRVVRALELAEVGYSLAPEEDRLWSQEMRHPTLVFGLELAREELERRIETRAEGMFEAGVQDEVLRALERPVSQTARQALGLEEVATLPTGEAKEAMIRRTRRYAAYQRKWMRRVPGLIRVRADGPARDIAAEILAHARATSAGIRSHSGGAVSP
jgi:tRNA dimethylallyltransferase